MHPLFWEMSRSTYTANNNNHAAHNFRPRPRPFNALVTQLVVSRQPGSEGHNDLSIGNTLWAAHSTPTVVHLRPGMCTLSAQGYLGTSFPFPRVWLGGPIDNRYRTGKLD